MGLRVSEDLSGGKIFQIFVVSDDIDQSFAAFQVLSPMLESFEDYE